MFVASLRVTVLSFVCMTTVLAYAHTHMHINLDYAFHFMHLFNKLIVCIFTSFC